MDAFYLALLLYFAAVVLALVDVFIPSGGMLLVLASLAAFASILFGFRSSLTLGMAMLTFVVASIPVFIVVAIKIWPYTPMGRRIILGAPQTSSRDTTEEQTLQAFVGRVLLTETALLPTGQIRIGYQRLNAVAESSLIEANEKVKIVGIREHNLIVRPTTEPLSPSANISKIASPEQSMQNTTAKSSEPSLLDMPADELGLDSIDDT